MSDEKRQRTTEITIDNSVDGVANESMDIYQNLTVQLIEGVNKVNILATLPIKNFTVGVALNSTNSSLLVISIFDTIIDRWESFFNCLFYTETSVATAGYGKIVTKTNAGKLVSCLYAFLGIPLLAVWAGSIGDKMVKLMEVLKKKIFKQETISEFPKLLTFLEGASIICIGSVIFLFLPAILFMHMEDWNYAASFYCKRKLIKFKFKFIFQISDTVISLTTIALGDLAAGIQEHHQLWYKTFIFVWFLFGLVWLGFIVTFALRTFLTSTEKSIQRVSTYGSQFNLRRRLNSSNTGTSSKLNGKHHHMYRKKKIHPTNSNEGQRSSSSNNDHNNKPVFVLGMEHENTF